MAMRDFPFPSAKFLLLVAALMLAAAAPQAAHAEQGSYTESMGDASDALKAILSKAGAPPRALEIKLEKDLVTLKVPALSDSKRLQAWYMVRKWLWRWPFWRVRGPNGLDETSPAGDFEGGLFSLSEIELGDVASVSGKARTYAGLSGDAHVTSITIGRALTEGPKPAYGNVRWVLTVESGGEKATVYADAKGEIFGAEGVPARPTAPPAPNPAPAPAAPPAANTPAPPAPSAGASMLRDEDMLPAAQSALLAAIGDKPGVHEIRFYDGYIYVETDSPQSRKKTASYSWDRRGLRRGGFESMNTLDMGSPDKLRFSMTEVDFSVLPKIKAAAREALNMPDGFISAIEAEKSARRPGVPRVLWKIEFKSRANETAAAYVDTEGEVVNVVPPESEAEARNWLEPKNVRWAFARLAKELGESIRYHEIRLDEDGAHLTAEDSAAPGNLVEFIMDEGKLERWGTPMFESEVTDARAFTLADLELLTEAKLAEIVSRTLERLQIKEGRVSRLTLERVNAFVGSKRRMVMVEIRVDAPGGRKQGRVTYEADGTELDVVTP